MRYLLDTDTCIYIMKSQPPSVRERLTKVPVGQVAISAIVLAELQYGIGKSRRRENNMMALHDFLEFCTVEDWPHEAAGVYGNIRASLERRGTSIGGNDLLIAAHAVHARATLVTHNSREFKRVPGLKIEDWA
ncbi:MAG: type II toxin-antitoxin system tRNA(fMet)-specific endonuclease VapC [Gammaproteobacteria bacterium]